MAAFFLLLVFYGQNIQDNKKIGHMKIKRAFISAISGNKQEVKILAITIRLKYALVNSTLCYYTLNKLSKKSGISYKTLQKYLPCLLKRGYVHFEGQGLRKILVVNSLSSKHNKKNCNIDILDFSSYKDIAKSLRAFLVLHLQSKKDLMRHLLDTLHNPSKSDDYKAVRRKVRNLVHKGILKDMQQKYVENGLSLKRIAKELGCCVVTAYRAIKYAVSKGWLTVEHHYEQYYAKGVHGMDIFWATFSTKDNIYVVHANTYRLSPQASACFS